MPAVIAIAVLAVSVFAPAVTYAGMERVYIASGNVLYVGEDPLIINAVVGIDVVSSPPVDVSEYDVVILDLRYIDDISSVPSYKEFVSNGGIVTFIIPSEYMDDIQALWIESYGVYISDVSFFLAWDDGTVVNINYDVLVVSIFYDPMEGGFTPYIPAVIDVSTGYGYFDSLMDALTHVS